MKAPKLSSSRFSTKLIADRLSASGRFIPPPRLMCLDRVLDTSSTETAAAPLPIHNGHNVVALEHESKPRPLDIVILGLSFTSASGKCHATDYRGLTRELSYRGHHVLFLERNAKWDENRGLPKAPHGRIALYSTLQQLKDRYRRAIRNADVVIVGSLVTEGAAIGHWVCQTAQGVTVFYDMDTPVTLAKLAKGDLGYLTRALIPRYQIYLSCTGGPILDLLETHYHSPMARPLFCSVDTTLYYPEACEKTWDLGYLGAYSEDRQPALDELLLEPARNWKQGRFVVAGLQYPRTIHWPKNVKKHTDLSAAKKRALYNAQKFSLNLTRGKMVEAGYSPSLRLFEAAACGTPIISDDWEGLDSFFEPNQEILITHSAETTLYYLLETTETERVRLAARARARVLAKHTTRHRALELESYVLDVLKFKGDRIVA